MNDNIEVISSEIIKEPMQIMDLEIIDFNRTNEMFQRGSGDALRTIFSWFDNAARATIVNVKNFNQVPSRNDWPGWKHIGNHPAIGKQYWDWFHFTHASKDISLKFGDSPDFCGTMNEIIFWGDIGLVSCSTFAQVQKGLDEKSLWISLLHDGSRQVIIQPLYSILDLFSQTIFGDKQ